MSHSGPEGRPAVVVASENALVAEAVAAGLAGRALEATTMLWVDDRAMPEYQPPCVGHDVGLLIDGLGSWSRLRSARALIRSVPLPWVVLTATPHGPMWGALLEAGAHAVLPSDTGLKRVCKVLGGVARGTYETSPTEREWLLGLWTELLARRRLIGQRVRSLTPREHEVLTMLHAGDQVGRIAQLLEVSPSTVRSQVKSVRRKLKVKTQLGAVAELDEVLELEGFEPTKATELLDLRA
jgi:DNA-binding NarL/FixJ family response regulator